MPAVRARVRWAISHNAIDNDIFARFGSGTDPNTAAFVRPCGGGPAADSIVSVTPVGFGGGLRRYYFHADLTDRDYVGSFLPPSAANPWFLSVLEKGFVNTEGIVDSFSVTVYNGLTATIYAAPNPATPTVETQTTTFWIPLDPATSLNHTPVLDPIGPRSGYEGLNVHFTVHAADPDGQALTYAASPLPLGATFVASTRTFSWQPAFGQAGTYHVSFSAADPMAASDQEDVTFTIAARAPGSNTAPRFDPLSDRTTHAGVPVAFQAVAHDRENDSLWFSVTPLPPHAAINPSTGAFTWSPTGADTGAYAVTFQVHDPGGLGDAQGIVLTATADDRTPAGSGACTPVTTSYSDTIGSDVQGMNNVYRLHPFAVGANVQEIDGQLQWSGGPAVDLDLYLLDPNGNAVGSGATATNDPEKATYVAPSPGVYQWKVVSYDNPTPGLSFTVTSSLCTGASTAGVGDVRGGLAFALQPNAPNPFQRSSVLRFALPAGGPVRLTIYDVSGRRVRTLVDGVMEAGLHQRVWDGRSDEGAQLHAGVYFSRLETPAGARFRTMVMVR